MSTLLRAVYLITMLTTGLVAGVFFSEYLGISPVLRDLPLDQYLRIKQGIIASYNPAMPILGIGGSVFFVAWLVMLRREARSPVFRYSAASFAALVASTAVTMIGELPANKRLLTLSADKPPPDLEQLRQHTLTVIEIRTFVMLLSFVLLALASSHVMTRVEKAPSKD